MVQIRSGGHLGVLLNQEKKAMVLEALSLTPHPGAYLNRSVSVVVTNAINTIELLGRNTQRL